MNSKQLRNGVIYLLLILALGAFLYSSLARRASTPISDAPIAKVATLVRNNDVRAIEINGDRILVITRNGETLQSRIEQGVGLTKTLLNLGVTPEQMAVVDVSVAPPQFWDTWSGVLIAVLPLLLLGAFFFFILRQAQGAGNQAFSFGKSRARMFTGDRPTVTFKDVAGNEEAKQELQEVVEFLKEPQKFAALGARIPKGVLLVGPPGTGKTLMAKAISGEAGVPFFSISGSEFVEMFVGVGASRVRDLFEQAKKNSPCIIFIDEIDAVGRHRGAGLGGSHDEREQTLNQILVEMDGFDTDTNIIIIAATNRPDILDPALLRPGRFDRRVTMDAPDMRGRRAILDVHVRGKPLAADVDLDVIAKQTPGFAGADLENLVNEAAILAARRNRRSIGNEELQEAIERVIAGPERRSRLITPKEKEIVAYHEAGHAVAMHVLPNHDPVHKVTIVPRGMAGGYTMSLPDEESNLMTRAKFRDQLVALLGGRVAEKIRFGDVTTGAANDLERVTAMARAMVTQWGMSERLGPIRYGEREEMMFLNRAFSEHRNYSDKVAQAIDEEVKRLVDEAHERCHQLLLEHWEALERVAQRLLEVETLNAAEFQALMRGETPVGDSAVAPRSQESPAGASKTAGQVRGDDKRADSGLDLGGRVPQPV
ncbi:ATP-dependent zinc metalloprotease FtsH [Caldilinea sp.]|jgi:cell division protease FtsH|uniref:ATP-dependent zinc metalloprotease FtsH n=1 Tax=Caldilinea sp. TaxID=2293560 RepID=UPI0021DD5C7C|nr:ATP-dependent zinc metalloprotease FtsH [Caldilinea sp.]GIV70845.1 MAG: ATP-dependent zinc metalloprotease FtsH [Caldilinea sp.]